MRVIGQPWHVVTTANGGDHFVEVWFFPSGMVPRALLGGHLTLSEIPLGVVFEETLSSEWGVVGRRKSKSEWGDFESALAGEFREAVEGGLLDAARDGDLTTGELQVTAAGQDPVNSSEASFRTAAYILGRVLASRSKVSRNQLLSFEAAARSSVDRAYPPPR